MHARSEGMSLDRDRWVVAERRDRKSVVYPTRDALTSGDGEVDESLFIALPFDLALDDAVPIGRIRIGARSCR